MSHYEQLRKVEEFFKNNPVADEPGAISPVMVVRSLEKYVDLAILRIHNTTPDNPEYREILRNLRYIARNAQTHTE